MASGDTKTEAMLNVLGNGGSGDEFRGCCNTKTQQYILDAIDRINNIQPGGGSYTAGDGITISDDTISVDTETIQPKLTAGMNITIDADNVISASGGGGVTQEQLDARILQSANYPTLNTVGVRGQLYELTSYGRLYKCSIIYEYNSGDYRCYTNSLEFYVNIRQEFNSWVNDNILSEYADRIDFTESESVNGTWYVTDSIGTTVAEITDLRSIGLIVNGSSPSFEIEKLSNSVTDYYWQEIYNVSVVQSSGDNSSSVMSQKAVTDFVGNSLNNLIGVGTSAPTTSTVGVLGKIYTDTTSMHTYQCTAVSSSGASYVATSENFTEPVTMTINSSTFMSYLQTEFGVTPDTLGMEYGDISGEGDFMWIIYDMETGGEIVTAELSVGDLATAGITFSGTLTDGDNATLEYEENTTYTWTQRW